MKFTDLVNKVSDLPCFSAGFLMAGCKQEQVNLQLARWVKDGRAIRIHKGLYVLAEPFRKCRIDPYCIANELGCPSYVSLQSALAWYGMIPEYVPAVVSVTAGRPRIIQTPLGRFEFRHIKPSMFWGYDHLETSPDCRAFIARPEKALLDLIYLTPGSEDPGYLKELRLQNLDRLDRKALGEFADQSKSPKLKRAETLILKQMEQGTL
jgi:predicted transcriptional regulator of viral defense system